MGAQSSPLVVKKEEPASRHDRADMQKQNRQRLKKKADFDKAHREGKAIKNELLVMVLFSRDDCGEGPRFGYSVSKKLGGAVERNRIKRRLKEALRECEPLKEQAIDLVIIPRAKIKGKNYQEIKGALKSLLVRAEILNK